MRSLLARWLAETSAQTPLATPVPPSALRFLSQEQCAALAQRIVSLTVEGGNTQTVIESHWMGQLRWARNQIRQGSDVRNTEVLIERNIRGAESRVNLNSLDDVALEAAVRRAERLLRCRRETLQSAYEVEYTEQHLKPTIWSDATYNLDAETQAAVARGLIEPVERAGLVAAGDLQVSAQGRAIMNSRGRALYYPFTDAQLSMTVRDPKGQGSGWAGVSHYDWAKIDASGITQRALEKCLASRNPVAVEPGRYTTILEPQAVSDVLSPFLFSAHPGDLDRRKNEVMMGDLGLFQKEYGQSKLGEVVMDERLNVMTDPMDPELGVVPFYYGWDQQGLEVYHPAQWIKQGVLMNLSYDIQYAVEKLGKGVGLQNSGSYRMSSSVPPVSIAEMIATTARGVLVTRMYMSGSDRGGYTRDGLWFIEKGKISKPIKNFYWEEDGYNLLQPTRLEQIGAPERVFSPGCPVIVPALKVKDFNFVRLVDAI